MKRAEYIAPAVCINDSKQRFTEEIARRGRHARVKDIETRTAPVLDAFIGRRVYVIRTGRGAAVVVGTVKISGRVDYFTVSAFRKDYSRHHIAAGTFYDMKRCGKKYGYILEDFQPMDPVPVLPETYTGDRSARDLSIMLPAA